MTDQTRFALSGIWESLEKAGLKTETEGIHTWITKNGKRVGELESAGGYPIIWSLSKTRTFKGTTIRKMYRTVSGFLRFGM